MLLTFIKFLSFRGMAEKEDGTSQTTAIREKWNRDLMMTSCKLVFLWFCEHQTMYCVKLSQMYICKYRNLDFIQNRELYVYYLKEILTVCLIITKANLILQVLLNTD